MPEDRQSVYIKKKEKSFVNTRKLKTILFTALLLVLSGLVGCGQKNDSEENLCHIVLEDGEGYHVTEPARTVKAGSNVNFTVTLDNSWQFLGTDYHGKTDITKDNDGKTVELVLHKVKYSESICMRLLMMPMEEKHCPIKRIK